MTVYPDIAQAAAISPFQCGPSVCYCAEAFIQGWNFSEMPDFENYRVHILATLMGKCVPQLGSKTRNKKINSLKECCQDVQAKQTTCFFVNEIFIHFVLLS